MNVRSRGLRLAALCSAVLLISCRSAIDDCYQRQKWTCVSELATMELERRPECCKCLQYAALAEKHQATRSIDPARPGEAAETLLHVSATLARAAECNGGSDRLRDDVQRAEQAALDIINDRAPSIWRAVDSIADRDDRIDAVIAHATFYGARCQHDITREYQRYIAYLSSRPTLEFRRRLLLMTGTPLANDLLQAYLAKRVRESGDDEIEVIRDVLDDLAGTEWEALLAGHLETRVGEKLLHLRDGTTVDRLCSHYRVGARRDACLARAQMLWTEEMQTATLDRLHAICSRITAPDDKEQCRTRLAAQTLRAAIEYPTPANLALAKDACEEHPIYRREWLAFLYRHDVRRNYEKISADVKISPGTTPDTVGLWEEYVSAFDGLARRMFRDENESLRSLDEGLSREIEARIEKLRHSAKERFDRVERDCNDLVDDVPRDPSSKYRHALDRCADGVIDVMKIDQRNARALRLLDDIEGVRGRLDMKRRFDWTEVSLLIAIDQAIRAFLPEGIGKIAYRFVRQVFGQP